MNANTFSTIELVATNFGGIEDPAITVNGDDISFEGVLLAQTQDADEAGVISHYAIYSTLNGNIVAIQNDHAVCVDSVYDEAVDYLFGDSEAAQECIGIATGDIQNSDEDQA